MEPVGALRILSAVAAAGAVTAIAAAPAVAGFLPNGDFERGGGSLAGWAGTGAAATLRADGRGGGHAARVGRRPGNPTYSLRATLNSAFSVAGRTYRGRGYVRSGTPGRRVCLKLLEITPGGSKVGTRSACRTATRRWRAFPEVRYRARKSGNHDRASNRAGRAVPAGRQLPGRRRVAPRASRATGSCRRRRAASRPRPRRTPGSRSTGHASADNEGVAAYTIYRRGIPIAIVSGARTDYTATAQPGTTAAYAVDAVDDSGNRSERSRAATVTTPSSGGVLIAAAGDIACDPTDAGFNGGNGTATACAEKATSDLILGAPAISAVLSLGDNQYGCGGFQPFLQSFDPSWGRFLSKIHPVAGNHEYQTSGGSDCAPDAAGYFRYFGAAAGNAQADSAWNAGAGT